MKSMITLGLLAIMIMGCTTIGRKLDTAQIDKIKKGETTREQVTQLIGAPDSMSPTADGGAVFMYMHMQVKPKAASFIPIVGLAAGGADMKNQQVMVTFGPDGIVKDVVSTYDAPKTTTGGETSGKP
jgi:outer membrane protein assembly factor BamE (lipoprotein component of BamABCDE complex)